MAHRLKPDQAHLAFVLAQQAYPHLTKRQWDDFIETACDDNDGEGPIIFGVENLRGYFMGICIGRVNDTPQYGRVFDVDPFVVFDLGDSGTLSRSLFLTLERHARSLGCNVMRIATPMRVDPETLSFPYGGNVAKDPAFLDRLVGSEQLTRSVYALNPTPAGRQSIP